MHNNGCDNRCHDPFGRMFKDYGGPSIEWLPSYPFGWEISFIGEYLLKLGFTKIVTNMNNTLLGTYWLGWLGTINLSLVKT